MTICALKTGKPHYLGEFGLNKTAGRDDRPKWKIKILQWKIKILEWKMKDSSLENDDIGAATTP